MSKKTTEPSTGVSAEQVLARLEAKLEKERKSAKSQAFSNAVRLAEGLAVNDIPALLEIVRLGHPTLRDIAQDVPSGVLGTPTFRSFAGSLLNTMFDSDGVGLASPQVAEGLRCFAYYVPSWDEGEDYVVPPTVLVNPVLHLEDEIADDWEGCLSIPEMRGRVPRAHKIHVEALDVDGNPLSFEATGFHARVIQHEFDHLEGIIFLDRMTSMASLCFEPEWMRYILRNQELTE
ncbi:MAG: peptide deformylase [Myxococcales bacterium]|nr:peptide deformylase [Myxococcales bacterium]MCB9644133.1 peptide deformylase [Myxococcales bacterium]